MVEWLLTPVRGGVYVLSNPFFDYKSIPRLVGRVGIEEKSIIDFVLVKKEMLKYVLDVNSVSGLVIGISDH